MYRGKSTSHREHMITSSFSSSNDDNVSLGPEQEEVPASTHDIVFCSAVPQRRGDVPSLWNQFIRKA